MIAQQMDPQKHTIVLCHHGMRSNMVRHSRRGLGKEQTSRIGTCMGAGWAEAWVGRNTCT